MPHISVVTTVFNEQACVGELLDRLLAVLSGLTTDFEIVVVDDGSRDGSWAMLAERAAGDSRIHGLRFSRNFGHHQAIAAGLDHAQGDWVVVMDGDLQDPPEAIPALLAKAREGFDVVRGQRARRAFPWYKTALAKGFYALYRRLTDTDLNASQGVFCLCSRRAVLELRRLRETARFFPALLSWVGFPQTDILVEHGKRFAGETKYSLSKQVTLGLNAMLSFSEKPLMAMVQLGFAMAALSTLYGAIVVVRAMLGQIVVLGYASLITAIFVVGGFTIATIGIVGLYVGRIFAQVKGRPLYVVSDRVGGA